VDTAEEVLARAGGHPVELFLVVGADLVPELGTWHRAEELRDLVTLAVVSRPTGETPGLAPGWRSVRVDGPQVAVSSSEVRDLLAAGAPVDGLVPPPVIRCIVRRGMYAVRR
jgi:nicotinate-nucleotide adenylyltransferase